MRSAVTGSAGLGEGQLPKSVGGGSGLQKRGPISSSAAAAETCPCDWSLRGDRRTPRKALFSDWPPRWPRSHPEPIPGPSSDRRRGRTHHNSPQGGGPGSTSRCLASSGPERGPLSRRRPTAGRPAGGGQRFSQRLADDGLLNACQCDGRHGLVASGGLSENPWRRPPSFPTVQKAGRRGNTALCSSREVSFPGGSVGGPDAKGIAFAPCFCLTSRCSASARSPSQDCRARRTGLPRFPARRPAPPPPPNPPVY